MLVKTGNFELKLRHLLIIGILVAAFSISFLIRISPIQYGFDLMEFDPFFNYRATQYLVDNGLSSYMDWQDTKSWYPEGRDVSRTSQVMLHITTATLYGIFGGGESLYSFTIMFPVIIGSLTVVAVFLLVRVIAGTSAGLFASLFFAVSPAVIMRGNMGWFKSEPLGLFYGIFAVYLFLSGIKSNNKKIAIIKLVSSGLLLSFSLASWGGTQFFVIPIGILIFALAFVRNDKYFVSWAIPLFVISTLGFCTMFERPGLSFVTGLGGASLILPTIFLLASNFLQKKSNEKARQRNSFLLLLAIIIGSIAFLIINAESEIINLPSYRYLNAINPFLTTEIPLVDSVAEHASLTISHSFYFNSILMVFAGFGVWQLFQIRNNNSKFDMGIFALIFGLIGVYISSAFIRLELFGSLGVIILSSIGLSYLFKSTSVKTSNKTNLKFLLKSSIIVFFVGVLITPMIFPVGFSWSESISAPPTILNGGTKYRVTTDDWKDAMDWLKTNSPDDAVVASWWDYGYWITTLSERTSLVDNATISTEKIERVASILLSSPDDAWRELRDWDVDYVLVFIAGERLNLNVQPPAYLLNGGGDELKKSWFIRIAGEPVSKYLQQDGVTPKDIFWNETLLGKLTPYTPVAYTDFKEKQTDKYQPGLVPVYVKDIKYNSDEQPFKLVYSSPSFDRETGGPIIGVHIYQINKNYNPNP